MYLTGYSLNNLTHSPRVLFSPKSLKDYSPNNLLRKQDNRGFSTPVKPFDVTADGQQAVGPDQGIKQS
jgi:hypothetical protein